MSIIIRDVSTYCPLSYPSISVTGTNNQHTGLAGKLDNTKLEQLTIAEHSLPPILAFTFKATGAVSVGASRQLHTLPSIAII